MGYPWKESWLNFPIIQAVPSVGQISYQCNFHLFTKFASCKVPPVMASTHGSVVPLAMFSFFLQNRPKNCTAILKCYEGMDRQGSNSTDERTTDGICVSHNVHCAVSSHWWALRTDGYWWCWAPDRVAAAGRWNPPHYPPLLPSHCTHLSQFRIHDSYFIYIWRRL